METALSLTHNAWLAVLVLSLIVTVLAAVSAAALVRSEWEEVEFTGAMAAMIVNVLMIPLGAIMFFIAIYWLT